MNNRDTKEQVRMGRYMILAAWVVALILLSLFFNNLLERQHNPNQTINTSLTDKGVHEVVLKRNRLGHYVARGAINGQPVNFLLDTGATVISIPEKQANKLGLRRGYASKVNTANGIITTYATRLDEVSIGKIRLSNVQAHINPHMKDHEILLGMSFLKKLELLQRGNTLTLRQPSQLRF
ncbi:MAG: TIGR02281 family clan AA aspartic protease [Gammaproteobacteria bacterium]|nr:MAG: TIGR02281 family clan AA aspartic protease [Gammaproteobacteria bacterium]